MTQFNPSECVILLHGLARSDGSMKKLAQALDDAGYLTVNVSYPSTKQHIEALAPDAITKALAQCPEDSTINFVTHSMGGILVRQYLKKNIIKNLGRVVMLGPPNKGSHVVDNLSKIPGFKLINGPAGMQLGTTEVSIPNTLGSANFELGIIAGNRSVNPILSLMLPVPNDGKVSVEHTKLEGMNDHIELPVTHSFMMNNKSVIAQIIYFLVHGSFNKG
ncbi:MAG: alpha/beta hydrolase [Gammaproteobacteria bacterium]|nr:MAG: alpha/beta hydrolase [Gammaproteobacteria bacterium]RKZ94343.1 MAG: alpha/beta hydrolase [Gammaproteobacteria bacterium]RKZ95907.1 MAG: alpha/beta hydrolase [Gammaproteobacteria bacterium]RKZ99593.1 MAG: alpha/beta hydrolase [Gammaproteobacteria bacterium]